MLTDRLRNDCTCRAQDSDFEDHKSQDPDFIALQDQYWRELTQKEWEYFSPKLNEFCDIERRARHDPQYACRRAKEAIEREIEDKSRIKEFRKSIKILQESILALNPQCKDYLEGFAQQYSSSLQLDFFGQMINQALDLMKREGRKPLPIRYAIYWLLVYYSGQSNRITVCLYGTDGSQNKPSDAVAWLGRELKTLLAANDSKRHIWISENS